MGSTTKTRGGTDQAVPTKPPTRSPQTSKATENVDLTTYSDKELSSLAHKIVTSNNTDVSEAQMLSNNSLYTKIIAEQNRRNTTSEAPGDVNNETIEVEFNVDDEKNPMGYTNMDDYMHGVGIPYGNAWSQTRKEIGPDATLLLSKMLHGITIGMKSSSIQGFANDFVKLVAESDANAMNEQEARMIINNASRQYTVHTMDRLTRSAPEQGISEKLSKFLDVSVGSLDLLGLSAFTMALNLSDLMSSHSSTASAIPESGRDALKQEMLKKGLGIDHASAARSTMLVFVAAVIAGIRTQTVQYRDPQNVPVEDQKDFEQILSILEEHQNPAQVLDSLAYIKDPLSTIGGKIGDLITFLSNIGGGSGSGSGSGSGIGNATDVRPTAGNNTATNATQPSGPSTSTSTADPNKPPPPTPPPPVPNDPDDEKMGPRGPPKNPNQPPGGQGGPSRNALEEAKGPSDELRSAAASALSSGGERKKELFPKTLLEQQILCKRIKVTNRALSEFLSSPDFILFESEVDKGTVRDRPEVESKLDVGFDDDDSYQDPSLLLSSKSEMLASRISDVKDRCGQLDEMVNTLIKASSGDIYPQNGFKKRKNKKDAERSIRANKKHYKDSLKAAFKRADLPAILGASYSKKKNKKNATFHAKTVRQFTMRFFGALLERESMEKGKALSLRNMVDSDDRGAVMSSDNMSMHSALQSVWTIVYKIQENMGSLLVEVVKAIHVGGGGNLLQSNLCVHVIDLLENVKRILPFSTLTSPEEGKNAYGVGKDVTGGGGGDGGGAVNPAGLLGEVNKPAEFLGGLKDMMNGGGDGNGKPDVTQMLQYLGLIANPQLNAPAADGVSDARLQLRPNFIELGGASVRKTREDAILDELLWNSFDHVDPNGYLGERNKIYRDHLRNEQLRYKAPLWCGSTFEPNHGIFPLNLALQTVRPPIVFKEGLRQKLKRCKRTIKSRSRKLQAKEILNGDLNIATPSSGLPHRKPTPFNFKNDNRFDLYPNKEPAGIYLNKRGFKSALGDETWNFPFEKSKRQRGSGRRTTRGSILPPQRAAYRTHYNSIAQY